MVQGSIFKEVAPYLHDPLILAGFFLLLFFGFGRVLLKSKLIPTLTKKSGYQILKQFLLYGFLLGIAIVLLGFGLKYRELSQAEQRRVLSMLSDEAKANFDTSVELAKNTEVMLNAMVAVATALRNPENRVVSAMFPAENVQPTPATPGTGDLAKRAFETLNQKPLTELEAARVQAVGKALHGTITRTLPTIQSLADSEHARYQFTRSIWDTNLPILRKVDAFPVSSFQQSYGQLERLRSNYDVTSTHVVKYLQGVDSFFQSPQDEGRLENVLAEERLAFSIVSAYGIDVADSIEKLVNLRRTPPLDQGAEVSTGTSDAPNEAPTEAIR